MGTELEGSIHKPRMAGSQQPLGHMPGMGSPSQPLEGTSPAHTLILDFHPPELGGQKSLLLFATRL